MRPAEARPRCPAQQPLKLALLRVHRVLTGELAEAQPGVGAEERRGVHHEADAGHRIWRCGKSRAIASSLRGIRM